MQVICQHGDDPAAFPGVEDVPVGLRIAFDQVEPKIGLRPSDPLEQREHEHALTVVGELLGFAVTPVLDQFLLEFQ